MGIEYNILLEVLALACWNYWFFRAANEVFVLLLLMLYIVLLFSSPVILSLESSGAVYSLLLKQFFFSGDLTPNANLKNVLVLLVSMFCLFNRSSSRFLFLYISLQESICLCFNCSLRSRWILLSRAASASYCLARIRSSVLDSWSSI